MNSFWRNIIYLSVSSLFLSSSILADPQSNASSNSLTDPVVAAKLFKAIFLQNRIDQIRTIKSVLSLDKYEKQYEITEKVLEKLFEFMILDKAVIESSDYIPGLELPQNSTAYEALTRLIDNTALYGEFQLKLPDITDRIMDSHLDWPSVIKWSIGFSNSTGLYDDKTEEMINLLCQEMNLIDRNENYHNPYRLYEEDKETSQKSTLKKNKIRFKKGPRMSKPQHNEL